jgi:hypothetical protein
MRQAWDLCVFVAAALFVVDVAVRRLSLEWPVRRPAEAPRDVARVTAAWQQARRRSREPQPAMPSGDAGSAPDVAARPVSPTAVAVQSPPVAQGPAAEPEPADDSPMGRLRAAKRRAREGGGG